MPHLRETSSQTIARRPRADTAPPVIALASGLGGLADALVSNGPRVIKTCAQLQLQAPKIGWETATHGLPLHGVVSSVGNLWCFTVQHLVKSRLADAQGNTSLLGALAGGLTAGVSESMLTNPARRLLVRHAVAQPRQSLRQSAQTLWQQEGLSGLWRGAPLAALRNGLAWGSFFATLHMLRKERKDASPLQSVMDSSIACAVACLVGTPLDTVVTHIQSQTASAGWHATMTHIARTRGIQGFYAGTPARLGQALPSATVSFLVMTQILRLIQSRAAAQDMEQAIDNRKACLGPAPRSPQVPALADGHM